MPWIWCEGGNLHQSKSIVLKDLHGILCSIFNWRRITRKLEIGDAISMRWQKVFRNSWEEVCSKKLFLCGGWWVRDGEQKTPLGFSLYLYIVPYRDTVTGTGSTGIPSGKKGYRNTCYFLLRPKLSPSDWPVFNLTLTRICSGLLVTCYFLKNDLNIVKSATRILLLLKYRLK